MGKLNSSKTRVVPVLKQLYESDPTGCSWLPKLIRLPLGENTAVIKPGSNITIIDHRWGDDEKKLNPPVALLSWLIRHPRKPVSGSLSSNPIKAEKRHRWIAGSREMVLEGLRLLRNNPTREDWHIFEGQTQPDVFIETDDLIIVIEGKRTEIKPTTTTKWMSGRDQMLRHLDCAWEIRGNKQLFGFYIVEGDDESPDVPLRWQAFASDTISRPVVVSSLPHRGQDEQQGIASCFIGVTTWQSVCMEFGIDWKKIQQESDE